MRGICNEIGGDLEEWLGMAMVVVVRMSHASYKCPMGFVVVDLEWSLYARSYEESGVYNPSLGPV